MYAWIFQLCRLPALHSWNPPFQLTFRAIPFTPTHLTPTKTDLFCAIPSSAEKERPHTPRARRLLVDAAHPMFPPKAMSRLLILQRNATVDVGPASNIGVLQDVRAVLSTSTTTVGY